MDELPADDDLLSCMLLEYVRRCFSPSTLEFEPAITTHKMNPHQRAARFDREAVSVLVRQHVIWERDLSAALAAFLQYVARMRVFEAHIQRYLLAYLPDAGFEYAITYRYSAARRRRIEHDRGHAETPPSLGRTDLCVLAVRSFQPDEIITHCRAALKDLSRAEDEALREEAAQARAADARHRHPRPQRDFSIIRSSSRKLSQLLLGPARFINHDCQPNAEFRRSGHQLTIRCIRPIKRNEEITTFYGENYFEPGNCECMCATCERRGQGYFAPDAASAPSSSSPQSGSLSAPASLVSAPHDVRTLRSSTSNAAAAAAAAEPAAPASPIRDALDPDAAGPECTCLTCQTTFRAPERWWTPDECVRCERHYKLFKADWPNRQPKEDPAASHSNVRPLKRAAPTTQNHAKRRMLPAELHTDSAASSPVKLSPMRTDSDASTPPRSEPRHGRRKYEVRSDDSDEGFDESHVALGPRILGHDASTDVLASYWGAPSGQRRERRKAQWHVEPLTDKRLPRRATNEAAPKDARRKASSEATGRATESAPAEPPAQRATTNAEPKAGRKAKPPILPGNARGRAVSLPAPNGVASSHKRSASNVEHTARPSAAPKLAIATDGPERTSVSNLALFWSGGVEGRTRQQARANATPDGRPPEPRAKPRAKPPPKRSDGEARAVAGRATPEVALPAAGAPAQGAKAEESAGEVPTLSVATESRAPHAPSPDPVIKSEVAPPTLSPHLPPTGPPRQPARRNLRWGSGKTSISRPLPGTVTGTGISLLSNLTARASPLHASVSHASSARSASPDRLTEPDAPEAEL